MNFFYTVILLLVLIFQTQLATAQALHWLSQPEIDVGLVANNGLTKNKISTNGRFVAFLSNASNLVADDNNFIADVFIRDMQTGITKLVSITASGIQANSDTIDLISAPTSDGRYIAFTSSAAAFPEANGIDSYLYVKNMQTGTLVNVSKYNTNSYFRVLFADLHLSDNGEFVTFTTSNTIDPLHVLSSQVYRKDLVNSTFELLSISEDGMSAANSSTELSDVSDNGRFILISSYAQNLTSDVLNNSSRNLFMYDTQNNIMRLVNTTPNGASSSVSDSSLREAEVSNNGHVVFESTQSDLVLDDTNNREDVFYNDNGSILRINLDANGDQLTSFSSSSHVTISGDGSRIAFTEISDELFPTSTNNYTDLYSYDTDSETLSLMSKTSGGNKANGNSYQPKLSFNGNHMVFRSNATDLSSDPVTGQYQSIFYYNFNTDVMRNELGAASIPNTIIADTFFPRISSDQRSVIYSSRSPNLVTEPINNNSLDLFLQDKNTNTYIKIASSVSDIDSDISASGYFISFRANTLQPEGNISLGGDYIFLYDRLNNSYTQIAIGDSNRVNNNGFVVFESDEDIGMNDNNGLEDIYVFNPNSQNLQLVSKDLDGLASGGYDFDIGGSDDNIWVTFTSNSTNIVENDTNNTLDVFLKNISSGTPISRVTETQFGIESNGRSSTPTMSEDGNYLVFITQADNLTNDDYSSAHSEQIMVFDRVNSQLSLASINDFGMPITQVGTQEINQVSISDSGRYVAYTYEDTIVGGGGTKNNNSGPNSPDFTGDTDQKVDVILFDTVTETPKLISKFINGSQSTDGADEHSVHIAEDLTVTPSLVGVVFPAEGGQLTGLPSHPGYQEIYLYQQGGANSGIIFTNGFE